MAYGVIGKIIIIPNIDFKVEKAVSQPCEVELVFHFIDQGTKDQRVSATCSRSQRTVAQVGLRAFIDLFYLGRDVGNGPNRQPSSWKEETPALSSKSICSSGHTHGDAHRKVLWSCWVPTKMAPSEVFRRVWLGATLRNKCVWLYFGQEEHEKASQVHSHWVKP